MKTYLKHYKLLISAVVLAVLTPFLWNCADSDPDYGRFWLLEPNIAQQRNLLPFTFTSERYYNYGYGMSDTVYQAENDQEWQTMLGDKTSLQDIHQILYYTEPTAFFGKKYNTKNKFIAALKQPKNVNLWQYLSFAKGCETIFNSNNEWGEHKDVAALIKPQIKEGQMLLDKNAQNIKLSQRIAYLLIKLQRLDKKPNIAKDLFEQYFARNTTKNWLNAAAIYQNACLQTEPVQKNIWLAKAWEASFNNPIWLYQAFSEKNLAASVNATNDAKIKAVMALIPATRKPGPALQDMKSAYKHDPTVRDLATLLAREVNKLENWLMSPTLYGFQNRIETNMYAENAPKLDTVALLKSDLAHLHACRAFVKQVIEDKKREDVAFWYLAGAHLAYLDKDFVAATEMAVTGFQIKTAPMNQKVQLHLIAVLAEIGEKGQISEATENKIPLLFKAIEQNKSALETPDELREKLAFLLSDLFIKRNEIAKGAFLLGKTSTFTPGFGYLQSSNLFEKLLSVGKPADFDKAIQMVEKPKTDFERWFSSEPHRYSTEMDWENDVYKPVKGVPKTWDIQKLREFKSMYFMRLDQTDSALIALQNVPEVFWKENEKRGDGGTYFQKNPFNIGIEIENLPLTKDKITQIYNKKTFLENLNVLRAASDPAKQQEAFLLLGNAYYNMTYYGTDWWLMQTSSKGSGEVDYINSDNYSAIPDAKLPKSPAFGWSALGFILLGFVGFFNKKHLKYTFFMLFIAIFIPFSCKKITPKPINSNAAKVIFEESYYNCSLAKAWYEKAQKINTDNDLGVAATFMLGKIEEHQQYYTFAKSKKSYNDEFKESENSFYSKLKGKAFKSKISCADFADKLK
jgi:hypothetical protein